VEENKNPGFSSEDFTRERLNQEKEQECRNFFNPEMQYMEERSQWFLEISSLVGTSSF
jgi:hypothetical protein